jgi:aminoglycoside phosphotransferase
MNQIQIMSQKGESTILLLNKLDGYRYSSKELTTKKKSMFLLRENLEEIKSIIKLYSMFM